MAPYANKLLMVRGIRAMNEWSFEGTLGQKNDPHTQLCGSYFTCHPVTPNADSGSASNLGKFDAQADRAIAGSRRAPSRSTPAAAAPLFMQIGGVSGSTTNTRRSSRATSPSRSFPGYGSPTPVYSSLTNLFGAGPVDAGHLQGGARQEHHRLVRDDLDRLSGQHERVGPEEAHDWTELLH